MLSYFYGLQWINFSFDFLFKSQQVTSWEWKFIPQTSRIPQIQTWLFHMVPLRDWTKIHGRISECNQFYSLVSLRSQNPRSSHNAAGILLRMKHIVHSIQNPQSHQTWTATTTTPEIFDTFIISLVLIPENMQDF